MTPEQWRQVEELYYAALGCDPVDRAALLASADPVLRREVESLLAQEGTLLEHPAWEALEVKAGDRLGPYEVLSKLGAGGMGEVWKARDSRLGRQVAIKLLPESSAGDQERLERFDREARAASALNHPNIVTIYEISHIGGRHFIAMELVHGRTLSELMHSSAKLAFAQAVNYAIQVCDGLGKAHRAGIVHRDIKPSNIMLTDDGLIKILDFGIAKLNTPIASAAAAEQQTVPNTPLTAAGVAMGTIYYMSPEQAAGEAATPRSDVFSMGVVLYEMIGGRRPFAGDSKVEIMRALLSADPLPLNSLAGNIPVELARIVQKCLEKNPEARYQDAGELGADLRAFQRHFGGSLSQSTATFPSPSPVRARQKFIAIWAALFAILLVGGGYLVWRDRHHEPAGQSPGATTSAEAFQRAREYLARYDRKRNVDRAIEALQPALQRDPTNAALQGTIAEAYVRKYSQAPDKKWLQEAVDSGRRAVAANDDLALAHVSLGMALAASGQNDDAAAQLERAIDLDPLNGPAILGLAKVRFAQNKEPEAEALYQKAIALSPEDWLPLAEQGVFYYKSLNAQYERAISSLKKSLQLTPDNVLVMKNLGAAYHMKGQYAEAANVFQQALELDPIASTTWANLGTMRYFQGHFSESVSAMLKAVELDPRNYLYWGNLGDAYRWTPGMKSKSADAYDKAISLVREQFTKEPSDAVARSRLATYLAKTGDITSGLAEAHTVEQSHANNTDAMFNVAVIYELAQDRAKALAALERAVAHGYSKYEVANEPEFAALRSDPGYGRIVSAVPSK